jgi:hypothetical protein
MLLSELKWDNGTLIQIVHEFDDLAQVPNTVL